MVRYCVAAATTLVSLDLMYFSFQKNPKLRKCWAGKVLRSTLDFAAVTSKYTVLDNEPELFQSIGLASKNRKLKSDAVPTIFVRQANSGSAFKLQLPQKKKRLGLDNGLHITLVQTAVALSFHVLGDTDSMLFDVPIRQKSWNENQGDI